jgi:hypothetical protein
VFSVVRSNLSYCLLYMYQRLVHYSYTVVTRKWWKFNVRMNVRFRRKVSYDDTFKHNAVNIIQEEVPWLGG